jgi:hypothetical protein
MSEAAISDQSLSGTLRVDKNIVLPGESLLLGLFKRQSMTPNSPKVHLVRKAISETGDMIDPLAAWARKDRQDAEPYLISHLSPETLAKVEGVIGVVCTIGQELELRSRKYFEETQYTSGYLLDQVGSFAVAILSRHVAKILSQQYEVATWAPGDTPQERPLSSQRELFDWVPAHQIGVRLSEHHLMIPAKSLSFVMLIGDELKNMPCRISCRQCVWQGNCGKKPRQPDEHG